MKENEKIYTLAEISIGDGAYILGIFKSFESAKKELKKEIQEHVDSKNWKKDKIKRVNILYSWYNLEYRRWLTIQEFDLLK